MSAEREEVYRAYMEFRKELYAMIDGPYAIQAWWAALWMWPTMSKAKRKRWRRYWGSRSPHWTLQRIGETTI